MSFTALKDLNHNVTPLQQTTSDRILQPLKTRDHTIMGRFSKREFKGMNLKLGPDSMAV